MRVTVFGATGRTGQHIVEQALAAGHDVVAFVRDPGKLDAEGDRLTVVEGDAYTGENVRQAVEGADAVLSTLGQTDAGPDDLLTVAGDRLIEAMEEAGVRRFVTLVGAGVREEGDAVSVGGRVMGLALRLLAGEVLADGRTHVERVRASELDWTVVRPPRLTDGPRTGEYRHGSLRLGMGDTAARADVAEFMLTVANEDRYVRDLPMIAN